MVSQIANKHMDGLYCIVSMVAYEYDVGCNI